jgi:hypothetical protein
MRNDIFASASKSLGKWVIGYFQNLMASNKSFWLIQGLRLFILHPTGAPLHLPYDHVTGDKWITCLYIRVAASIVPFILLLQKITRNPHSYPIIFEYVRDSTTIYIVYTSLLSYMFIRCPLPSEKHM